MKKSLKLWLVVVTLCLTTGCETLNVVGLNAETSFFLLVFCMLIIFVYEILIRVIVKALKNLLKEKKPEKVDLKSLELEIEHKKNELGLVEKLLKGKQAFIVQHLQMEKFEYVELLNEARKFAANKKLSEKDQTVLKESISRIEALIPRLNNVTEIARNV